MLQKTVNQVAREAQAVIARHQQAKEVPRVLWLGLKESERAFAARCHDALGMYAKVIAAVPYGYAVPFGVQRVEFSQKLFELLHSTPSRFRCGSGGRSSGRSWAFARALLLRVLSQRMRVLCAREVMNALRESVHHLLCKTISDLGFDQYFDIMEREIRCPATGSEILFAGLGDVNALKSLEDVQICYVEESEAISKESVEVLIPTIRTPGSEIWLSGNPNKLEDTFMEFVDGKRPNTRRAHVIFTDNPWYPAEALEDDRLYDLEVDANTYEHVWMGRCRTHSDSQVFANKYVIQDFPPVNPQELAPGSLPLNAPWFAFERGGRVKFLWQGPFVGMDFGFSVDPSAVVMCWIKDSTLYVEYEVYARGCETDKLPALLRQIPGIDKPVIRADCARPDTINYLTRHGFPNMVPCVKKKGSVEDGITLIRSFKRVVIHPRCERTAEEFRLYSYKVDKPSGKVLTDVVDAHNHCIDSIRYALAPLGKRYSITTVTPLRI